MKTESPWNAQLVEHMLACVGAGSLSTLVEKVSLQKGLAERPAMVTPKPDPVYEGHAVAAASE